MPLINDMRMWIKKQRVKPLEKGNTMPKTEYEMLEAHLKAVGESLQRQFRPSFYFVPVCPECYGILGQMAMSKNLICYNCGREYTLEQR